MKLATADQDVSIPEVFERRNVAVGSTAMILDLFADKIYSHKELAVVRELSCNAHDSHVIAGTTDIPFLVHIPTALEPWFSIRDFGTGLPDEDIANIYGAIGISTKRQSNEVIGCFGIGSLAPYSMADSFVVKSYYNGTLSTYQCMRDDQRNPVVIPLGSVPTDEANGLEIKVTVADRVQDFKDAAIKTFKFWSGTIPQVNDELVMDKIESQKDSYVFEGEDFGLTSEYGSMVAVMGNIAYEIPSSLLNYWNCDGYMTFSLGELEFDTSRERLDVSDKNRKAIEAKTRDIKNSIAKIASEKIDSLTTPYEKWKVSQGMAFGQTSRLLGTEWFDKYSLPKLDRADCPLAQWTKSYNVHPILNKANCVHYSRFGVMRYFLDKPRMTGRIKEAMRGLKNGSIFTVFSSVKQAESVGVPKELLEDLEVLPKVVRVNAGRVKGTTSKYKTFELVRASWRVKDNWKETDIDLSTNDDIVFLPISRWKVEGSLDAHDVIRALRILRKKGVDTPSVYGLKTSFTKTKAFKNANFVSFESWLEKTLEKIIPENCVAVCKNQHLRRLLEIHAEVEFNKELQEIKDLQNMALENEELFNIWSGMLEKPVCNTKMDNSLNVKVDAYMEKYSMLTFVGWIGDTDSERFKTILKYLGLKAKKDKDSV